MTDDHDLGLARVALPAWFHAWARDHMDSDSPPPTPTRDDIRALLDGSGFVAYPLTSRTNPGLRSRVIDRIRELLARGR
jgi:hypothetical protein